MSNTIPTLTGSEALKKEIGACKECPMFEWDDYNGMFVCRHPKEGASKMRFDAKLNHMGVVHEECPLRDAALIVRLAPPTKDPPPSATHVPRPILARQEHVVLQGQGLLH